MRGNIMRNLLLGLVLLLGACASVPMATPGEDAAGKRFEAPPPGRSNLYVYRFGVVGAATANDTTLGPRALGSLGPSTWLLVTLEPGTYDVRCNAENSASTTVQLAAGETRYVEVSVRIGFTRARCAIAEATPEAGRVAVMSGSRAADIR
jgi:hypothetical protein